MRYRALPRGHRVAERYRIEELIGQGRSSAVYRALDVATESRVALKVLDPFLAQDPVSLERFAREVRIIRTLEHPNVVNLYSFFRAGGFHVICMEWIDGVDGAVYLRRYGRLAVPEFLPLAKALASAVASCHKAGVLHRDLKPQNVLLTAGNEVKLVDFGVAKISTMSDLTKTGTVIGTPEYMAPEQFTSRTADPRSDVYSLGAVLYQFLTERPPHAGTSLAHILSRQLSQEIEPVSSFREDVPAWLEAVVLKCLATDRSRRYQSCLELLAELEKGERSLARYEAGRRDVLCLRCQAEQIAGLPLCHECGTLARDVYARGRHALVLYQCDEPDAVAVHLSQVYQLGDRDAIRARIDEAPALLLQGVSEATASALASDLAVYPCELAVSDNLPRQLRLPKRYLLYGCLALLPMFFFAPDLGLAGSALLILASEVLLILLYLRKIRPVVKLGALKLQAKAVADPFLLPAAKKLRQLKTRDLKHLLGRMVRSYLAIRRARGAAAAAVDSQALKELIEQSFRTATALAGYEVYLESRSLNDIKQKLDAAELKLRHAAGAEKAERLIEAKAALQADFKRYQEVQALHSRLFVGLLNSNAALQELAAALDGGSATLPAADLAHLARELTPEDPDDSAGASPALVELGLELGHP